VSEEEGGIWGEEDAAVVRQWRREDESAYHNAPVAVAIAITVVFGDNNICVPGNQGRGPTQENARCDTVHATERPRLGHTVVGAGTYCDGMRGWVAFEREYARLAMPMTTMEANDEYGSTVVLDTPSLSSSLHVGERRFTPGPLEVALYYKRCNPVK